MAQQPSSILLKGGTLLLHNSVDGVAPTKSDLLIVGNVISKIAPNIPTSPDTKVLDCTSKIVSPGFISTHAHLWQTQLKGQHHNHTLVEYMPSGAYSGALFSVTDLFWGELSGALEALDAGTTTVVDHSHLNLGPEYPRAALHALATSGLRSVYCYSPPRHVPSLCPLTVHEDAADNSSVLADWTSLAAATHGNGRVTLGFAMDNIYLPVPQLQAVYAALRAGPRPAQVITTHSQGGPAFGGRPHAVGILDRAGLLGPDVLLSHAPGLAEEDIARLAAAGAGVSSTPNTEMQMGWEPVAMWPRVLEGRIGSLGIDCHSWGTSYIPTQMTLALQQRRLARAQEAGREGKWVRHVEGTVEEVFNLGTVVGAKAVGMDGKLGRLREGYQADVVVFDGQSPGMLAAAVTDPVAAVVLHSSVRDVEAVIVDGELRKEDGKLCDVKVEEPSDDFKEQLPAGELLSWETVAKETLKSRQVVIQKINKVDFVPAQEAVIDNWHMDRSAMVER